MKTISKADKTSNEDLAKITSLEAYKAATENKDWEEKLQYNNYGDPKSGSYANAALILSHDSTFADNLAYNEFTGEITTTGAIKGKNYSVQSPAGIADSTVIGDLQIMVDDKYQVGFSNDIITKGALYAARQHTFNPLLDRLAHAHALWIKAGRPKRLEKLFVDTLGASDTPATNAMTRLFFDGLVTRAHEPGAKFDYMTVLYSQKQGIGKTWLLSKIGGEYYTDNWLDMKTKDAAQLVAQKWLVNDDELSVITDHRANPFPVVKSFITRQNDEFRPPYTAKVENFPRRFILAGTTNEQSILKDATGSRRFNVITCGVGEITRRVKDLTENDIMLYLGEAEDRYQKQECRLVATADEQKLIEDAKASFEAVDETAEALEIVLAALYPTRWWYQSREAQRNWIAHILDGDEDKNDLPAVDALDRLNISWALDRIFNLDPTHAKQPQYERLQAKLISLMDANPEWEKPNKVIKFGKTPKRGYLKPKR